MSSDIPFPAQNPGKVTFSVEKNVADLRTLFHQLNNQLGIILANAELLESRSDSDATVRASHIVSSTVEAIALADSIRDCTGCSGK
tara:strand:- start:595 stop:852 length:258 start_codon:yes stop_codon:yes gene_type:complete